jgi:hypothetical protein
MTKWWLLIILSIVILGLCVRLRSIRSRKSPTVLVSYSVAIGILMGLLVALLFGGHISDLIVFR